MESLVKQTGYVIRPGMSQALRNVVFGEHGIQAPGVPRTDSEREPRWRFFSCLLMRSVASCDFQEDTQVSILARVAHRGVGKGVEAVSWCGVPADSWRDSRLNCPVDACRAHLAAGNACHEHPLFPSMCSLRFLGQVVNPVLPIVSLCVLAVPTVLAR